jgi:hypothetical protein
VIVDKSFGYKYKIKAMDRSDLSAWIGKFETAFKAEKWKNKTPKIGVEPQCVTSNPNIHSGLTTDSRETGYASGIVTTRQILAQDRQQVEYKSQTVSSKFTSLDEMLKSTEQLKDVLAYIKNAGLNTDDGFQKSHQKSEADNILTDLGVVNAVVKTEEGEKFYQKTAQQVSDIFTKILPKKGNVMSLIDVYLYYNRLMGLNLITPDDLLKSTRLLDRVKSPLELKELDSGVKVLLFKSFDKKKDFVENIMPYLDEASGMSAEELAKKSDVSTIVAKLKLEDMTNIGALVLDNSMEGLRYYMNEIITNKEPM